MRILLVHNRYSEPGGEDVVVDAQRELLLNDGHSVHAIETVNEKGLAGMQSFVFAPWNPFAARRVAEAAASFQPDVAYVHNTWFSFSPSIVRAIARLSVPTVMTLHNYRLLCANASLYRDGSVCTLCVGRSPTPGLIHRCYRGVAGSVVSTATVFSWRATGAVDSVDAFVVFTEQARSLMVEGGLPAERTHVIPHATADPGERLTPASESDVCLYVGRLSPEKGILDLVENWDSLGHGMRLLVAGDGPLRADIERAAQGMEVEVVGRLESAVVLSLMQTSRCLVMPSKWPEPFGMVLIEALAASLPVITTGVVPLAAGVERHKSGWVVGDALDWTQAFTESSDSSAIDERSRNARLHYQMNYTPERLTESLVRLFHAVAR